jgi:hypothetical protein
MRLKRPYVASLDQVRITHEGEVAVIEYAEPRIWTTHFNLGREIEGMSDQEILDRFNAGLVATEQFRAEHEHVAIEIPPGKPQIEYDRQCDQWVPRGDVLRCVVDDGGAGEEPIIHIDDYELSWREFGRLLTTCAGWGMRIVFVPDDQTHVTPAIEVREPREGER